MIDWKKKDTKQITEQNGKEKKNKKNDNFHKQQDRNIPSSWSEHGLHLLSPPAARWTRHLTASHSRLDLSPCLVKIKLPNPLTVEKHMEGWALTGGGSCRHWQETHPVGLNTRRMRRPRFRRLLFHLLPPSSFFFFISPFSAHSFYPND